MALVRGSLLIICAVAAASLLPHASIAAENGIAADRERHSSPQAVFDAYRTARSSGDWPSVYSCWSPEARKVLVFEALFSCQMQPETAGFAAIVEKYGLQDAAIDRQYRRIYKHRHGADPPMSVPMPSPPRNADAERTGLQKDDRLVPAPAELGSMPTNAWSDPGVLLDAGAHAHPMRKGFMSPLQRCWRIAILLQKRR